MLKGDVRKIFKILVFVALLNLFVVYKKFYIKKNLQVYSVVSENLNKSRDEHLDPFSVKIPLRFIEHNRHVISPHNYQYKIEPKSDERCLTNASLPNKDRRLALILVHSASGNFQHRNAIRKTWAAVSKKHTKLVFLLGTPVENDIQFYIEEESKFYGDILQETFLETYRNITLKAVMGMKYVATRCPAFEFVCKSDDDMFVKSQIVFSQLASHEQQKEELILCRVSSQVPVERSGKYQVPTSIYEENTWPPFCFGGFWIASCDVIIKLYKESLYTPQLYLDDVYVTGILREKLRLKLRPISKMRSIFCHAVGNWQKVEAMWRRRFVRNDARFRFQSLKCPVEENKF